MNRALAVIIATCTLVASGPAQAAVHYFRIADASQIQWLMQPDSGAARVYLRNLNQFDSSVLGCCYNYYIDLETTGGRAAWAALLSNAAQGKSIWVSVASQTQAGVIYFVANLD